MDFWFELPRFKGHLLWSVRRKINWLIHQHFPIQFAIRVYVQFHDVYIFIQWFMLITPNGLAQWVCAVKNHVFLVPFWRNTIFFVRNQASSIGQISVFPAPPFPGTWIGPSASCAWESSTCFNMKCPLGSPFKVLFDTSVPRGYPNDRLGIGSVANSGQQWPTMANITQCKTSEP